MNFALPMFRSLLFAVAQKLFGRRAPGASVNSAGKALQNPKLQALLAVLAIVYAVSPVDALPDFIPVLGWLDDGLVLWIGLSQAWRAMRAFCTGPRRAQRHRDNGDPRQVISPEPGPCTLHRHTWSFRDVSRP